MPVTARCEGVRVAEERTPAGWYPDPSGLPQLRWWDNHKWTEFVSDSQLEQEDEATVSASTGAHAASHSATASAAEHIATGYTAEHSAAAHIAAQAVSATPMQQEQLRPEPIVAEPIVAEPAARYDSGPRVDPSTAPDLRSAFDAMFTEPAPEPAHTPEPSLVDAFDQTFGYATPGTPDPAEAMFAASATSPVGVGTGETIGEALMRALQSA